MIPKKFKYKAKQQGNSFWNYFETKERAKKFATSKGIVRKR